MGRASPIGGAWTTGRAGVPARVSTRLTVVHARARVRTLRL